MPQGPSIPDVDGNAIHTGDIVELVECDQWPAMIGRRGVVHRVPDLDDQYDKSIIVLFDDPNFSGYVTLATHWRVVE